MISLATKQEVYTYLQHLAVGLLSTVSSEGYPYSSIIYFDIDTNLDFYFVTKSDSKKAANLRNHKKASITTIDVHNPPITVQSTGMVEEIEDQMRHIYVMRKMSEVLKEKSSTYWPPPISRYQQNEQLALFRYVPNWLRVGNFSEQVGTNEAIYNKNPFFQIIPEQK